MRACLLIVQLPARVRFLSVHLNMTKLMSEYEKHNACVCLLIVQLPARIRLLSVHLNMTKLMSEYEKHNACVCLFDEYDGNDSKKGNEMSFCRTFFGTAFQNLSWWSASVNLNESVSSLSCDRKYET